MAVSIRQIAQYTGLSTATVSDALRGTGRVAGATRELVRNAAQELGYKANPIVSEAMSLARKPLASRYRETIAVITQFPPERALPFQTRLLEGIQARAEVLGYKVESLVVSARAADHRRVSRILTARGIRGLIILPRIMGRMNRFHLDWSKFAVLEIGRTIRSPINIHRVERAIYYELIRGFHLLKKAGYRRIGLAINPREDSSRWGVYTAAYLMYQQQVAHAARIPSLGSIKPWVESSLGSWMRDYRPDVLVIQEYHWVCDWLQNCGYRWPEDVSIFSTNNQESNLTGFRADVRALGKGAADMMSVLLDNNETGLPSQPRSLLVSDVWKTGNSLKYQLPEEFSPTGGQHQLLAKPAF